MDMGMSNKKMLRRKAMESMMKEGPAIAIKIAKKSVMSPESEMAEQAEPEQMDESGFVSMMVSPEEKKMILEMRKGGGDQEEEMEMA